MLNRFFPLSKTPPIPSPIPVVNRQYQNGWRTNANKNQMKNTPIFFIVFQVLRVLLKKNVRYSHQIFYFLLFYISCYISRYFSQIFRTSVSIISKKIFITIFPFLTDSLNPTTLMAKIC